MKRRRGLLAIWVTLGALLLAVAVTEWRGPPASPVDEGRRGFPVFDFGEAEIGAVDALYQGKAVTLMRDPEGRWFRHGGDHRHGAAAAAPGADGSHRANADEERRIAEQMSLTARMRADRRLTPERGLDAYGLANPAMVFIFHGRRGNEIDYSRPLAALYVGDPDPTEYAFYARREGDKDVAMIPRYHLALLLALTHGEAVAPSLEPPSASAPAAGRGPSR